MPSHDDNVNLFLICSKFCSRYEMNDYSKDRSGFRYAIPCKHRDFIDGKREWKKYSWNSEGLAFDI